MSVGGGFGTGYRGEREVSGGCSVLENVVRVRVCGKLFGGVLANFILFLFLFFRLRSYSL